MATDFSEVYAAFAKFEQAGRDLDERALKAVARRRAQAVRAAAAQRLPGRGDTPHATGATRAALQVIEDTPRREYRVEVGPIPGRDPMVPVYIEFGTVGTPARPFLRPAVDENVDAYLRDIDATVTSVMEKAIP